MITLPHLISLLVALPLLIFSLRRLLFTITALATPTATRTTATLSAPPALRPAPDLLVLIPCRNDGASLPPLVQALLHNGYPPDHLRILLIDDGSTDDSSAIIDRLSTTAASSPAIAALHLHTNHGKAAALNAGLAAEPWGDVITIYDADHRPAPGGLAPLAEPFADPRVGAVSGRTEPGNALASPSAYYAAIERLVHQHLTLVAKDRLHLAPAILGSHCAYRRPLLHALGGFTPGAFLEDTDLTVRIATAGYHTRYVESTPAYDEVPATLRGYWRQHLRWSRGFQDVAIARRRNLLPGRPGDAAPSHPSPGPLLRLELLLFSLGYLDRLALLAAAALLLGDALFGLHFDFPLWFFLLVLALPYLQVLAALWRVRRPLTWWVRLPYLFLLFPIDLLVVARSALDTLLDRPRRWIPTPRQET